MSFILPFLAPIAAIGGVVTSMANTAQQSKAQQQMYTQQAQQYQQEAANRQAEAKNQAAAQKEQYRQLGERQKSAYASSGISLDSGSVLNTLAATDASGEIAALEALYGGTSSANKLNYQAQKTQQQAQAARKNDAFGMVNGAGKILNILGNTL